MVVVENFECVESNIEIINFLSHLATYENVKIIILTRNDSLYIIILMRFAISIIR